MTRRNEGVGNMDNVKRVIVLRKDLNMRKGKMVSQGAHAALKVFTDQMHPQSRR